MTPRAERNVASTATPDISITLGVAVSAYSSRIIRSAMVEVMRQDYVRLARRKACESAPSSSAMPSATR